MHIPVLKAYYCPPGVLYIVLIVCKVKTQWTRSSPAQQSHTQHYNYILCLEKKPDEEQPSYESMRSTIKLL